MWNVSPRIACSKSSNVTSSSQPSTSAAAAGGGGSGPTCGLYVVYVTLKMVELAMPEGRQGLPKLVGTKQILESWRSKRVIGPATMNEVIEGLNGRGVPVNESSTAPGQVLMSLKGNLCNGGIYPWRKCQNSSHHNKKSCEARTLAFVITFSSYS